VTPRGGHLQPEPGDRGGCEQDREQRAWHPRPPGMHQEQERQDGHGDHRRGEPGVTEVRGERCRLRQELLAGDGHAGSRAGLPGDHDQRDPRQVTHQHRPGQQVREESEPRRVPPRGSATRHLGGTARYVSLAPHHPFYR
jgi:hypothetical protein